MCLFPRALATAAPPGGCVAVSNTHGEPVSCRGQLLCYAASVKCTMQQRQSVMSFFSQITVTCKFKDTLRESLLNGL